jgi:hypothetical protein
MADNRTSGVGSRAVFIFGNAIFVFLTSAGCGGTPNEGAPARSPSQEYPPPPTQTSDGEVEGADRIPSDDKLETSPRIGTRGVVPAAQPSPGPGNRPSSEPRHPAR